MNRLNLLRPFLVIAAAALLSLAATANAQNKKAPSLAVESTRLVASNFSPGSTLFAYSVALEPSGYYTATNVHVFRAIDSDKDGQVVFTPKGGIPFRSVWIVADERSAEFAVGSPAGFAPPQGTLPTLRKHGNAVDEIDWPGHASYLVYIHPGQGAWAGFANDAAPADGVKPGDYLNAFSLVRLTPLAKGNADRPVEIHPGGTLFLVDAYDLRTVAVKVDGAMTGAAK